MSRIASFQFVFPDILHLSERVTTSIMGSKYLSPFSLETFSSRGLNFGESLIFQQRNEILETAVTILSLESEPGS
jgi:hypothetical protein